MHNFNKALFPYDVRFKKGQIFKKKEKKIIISFKKLKKLESLEKVLY